MRLDRVYVPLGRAWRLTDANLSAAGTRGQRGLADRADADDPLERVTSMTSFLPSPDRHNEGRQTRGPDPGVARARAGAPWGNVPVTPSCPTPGTGASCQQKRRPPRSR